MGIFGSKYPQKADQQATTEDVLPAYMTGAAVPAEHQGVNLSKAAKISVTKRPSFSGRQFALYKGSDVSYSMDGFINNGDLDYLTEGISVVSYENRWDADNIVPAFPYGRNVSLDPFLVELGKTSGVGQKIVQHANRQRVNRGGTNFVPPVDAIVRHYQKSDDWGLRPALAFIQTDGINSDQAELSRKLTEYSKLPIHWVFVYYGDVRPDGRDNAANLRALDDGSTMRGRKVDNVSVFIAGPEPKRVTPMELYDGLLTGPAQWITDATQAGILR